MLAPGVTGGGGAPRRVLLLLLSTLALAGARPAAAMRRRLLKETFNQITFPVGADLLSLPGADILKPAAIVNDIAITLAPAVVEGPTNGPKLFKFTTMAYVNDATGKSNVFGPTMRVTRGSFYVIKLTNALVQAKQDDADNTIHNYGNTNMHTHGLHAELGVPSQDTASVYILGDNPFFDIEARKSSKAPPQAKIFNLKVPSNHMPGLHWYHPHLHGSTTLQVGTAHGMIIVEDDNGFWLTDPGCAQFRAVIEAAEEVLLDIQLFFFKTPTPKNVKPLPKYSKEVDNLNNGNYQYYSSSSAPRNKYGTGANRATGPAVKANKGRGLNVLLVNGGHKPVVKMAAGVWQRWRMLYSGVKGFMVIAFFDAATNLPTAACEMMLYAKDGVYLLSLPRKVDGVFLAAANRGELLVRCSGAPGATYVASTRSCQPFSANCFGYLGDQVPADRINHIGPMFQDVLFTVQLTAPPPLPPGSPLATAVAERACAPRRASYAADIRDAALAAAGAAGQLVQYSVGYGGLNTPNSPQPLPVYFYACGYTSGGETDFGNRFAIPDKSPLTLELGKIVQWNFLDLDFHPMHTHINPYQIQQLNSSWVFTGSSYTSYFEVGDFHDTLTLPMINLTMNVKVPLRFQPGQYSGYTVSHCHFLPHEDVGCMKVVWFKCPTLADDKQAGPCPGFSFPVNGSVPDVYD